jgi:hypothetical protein
MTQTPTAFIEELERENRAHLARIDAVRDETAMKADRPEVIRRLRLALRQEMEAAEIAALWLPTAQHVEVKLALARMCGDEAAHYRRIVERLAGLGENVAELDPFAEGRSGFYTFLAALSEDVERVAAACFTREAIGHLRNEQFIEFAERAGDPDTAAMYREHIQPDEWSHVLAGRALLERFAVGPAAQEKARAAARRTLELAEGAVEAIVHKQGMSCAPGC